MATLAAPEAAPVRSLCGFYERMPPRRGPFWPYSSTNLMNALNSATPCEVTGRYSVSSGEYTR